ncbi:UNVERIFIED_CONTAM: hypothetical protein NCL1_13284 [Trichonephila clavipes]
MIKKSRAKALLNISRELRRENVHTPPASFCAQFYMSSKITQLMWLQLGVTAASTSVDGYYKLAILTV